MAEFTLQRFNECNRTFLSDISAKRKWIYLWTAAIVLLFLNLGTGAITASEGRWFAVAQEMIASGDWLTPKINGEVYYDKPLVSYWLIAIVSYFVKGIPMLISEGELPSVTELSARVPSALAALLALFSVISMTKRLFGEKSAYIAAWVFVTMYSFAWWGRLAEADMENLAFITAAVALYFKVRENPGLGGYALFWIICAIGAQTKGLAAFVIPGMLAFADMCITRTLKKHISFRSIGGLAIGLGVYCIPFVLSGIKGGGATLDGVVLVFRENIVRAINPWDHKDEAFYMYFRHVAQLTAPWTPFFVLAFIGSAYNAVKSWKIVSAQEKWLLAAVVLIFCLFSASQSRRVYYILPILPFCAMMTGVFLEKTISECVDKFSVILKKISDYLLLLIDYIIPLFAVFLIVSPALFIYAYPKVVGSSGVAVTPNWFFAVFYFLMPICGVAISVVWTYMRKKKIDRLYRVIAVIAFSFVIVFAVVNPNISSDPAFRSEKQFALDAHNLMFEKYNLPPENIVFWLGDYSNLVFYLDLPKPAEMYSVNHTPLEKREFFDDAPNYKGGIDEFRAKLEKIKREGGAVIARSDRLGKLPSDLALEIMSWPPFVDSADDASDVVRYQRPTLDELRYLAPKEGDAKAAKKTASILKKKHVIRIYPVGGNAE